MSPGEKEYVKAIAKTFVVMDELVKAGEHEKLADLIHDMIPLTKEAADLAEVGDNA